MKMLMSSLRNVIIALGILFSTSFSQTEVKNDSSSDIVLVASTPGDSLIKSQLTIPQNTKIDFIRWDLTLKNGEKNSKTFLLSINFGIGQPNTSGFIGGGQKFTLKGKYTISHNKNREIYQLKSEKQTTISFIKMNDNLFHLLTPDNKLMVGNGGWSYTLNRKKLLKDISQDLPSSAASSLSNDTSRQMIFVGRTPCSEFAKQYNLKLDSDCFKLKWKLILNRDPHTLKPTTYTLKRTGHRSSDIEGKWIISKGLGKNPNVVIYQLDPDKPEESISIFAGDENVLFLLDRNEQFYIGNKDFSYTFNKE